MKFSTQNLLSIRDGQTDADVYAHTLEECRLADALGFDTVWLAEHHFSSYGICPSLDVLAAALARETRRVRIGTAVVVAPFAHPLVLPDAGGGDRGSRGRAARAVQVLPPRARAPARPQ